MIWTSKKDKTKGNQAYFLYRITFLRHLVGEKGWLVVIFAIIPLVGGSLQETRSACWPVGHSDSLRIVEFQLKKSLSVM